MSPPHVGNAEVPHALCHNGAMAELIDSQVGAARERILHLATETLVPDAVDVAIEEWGDDETIVVTIHLRGETRHGSWDADDFLTVRLESSTIAHEEFGSARDIRMLYQASHARDGESEAHPGDDGFRLDAAS